MDEKTRRLILWARGKKAPPFTLDINPTDRCNLKCLHCWQRGFENIDSNYELSNEKLVEIAKEAIKFGVEEFEITGGGEPLIRMNLILELMKIIKKNKKLGNMTTNGTLFTSDSIKEIVQIGWDRITFSIDGPDKEANDYQRGKGSFERIMNSICLLNYWKKILGKDLPVIKFNVVVYKKNYNKICEMIELARKVNCKIVHFDSLTIHSKLGKKLKLSKRQGKDFENHAIKAKKLSEKYSIWTDADQLTSKFLEKSNKMTEILKEESCNHSFFSVPCYEPWWHLVIKVDGSAQPCCLYDLKEENVKNGNLKEIWLGPTFQRIRNEILNGKFSEFCSICNVGQVTENRRIGTNLASLPKCQKLG